MKISKLNKSKYLSSIDFSKIWSLIPARSGSLRIKNKNLQQINNKELILFSIAISKKLKDIDETFISTDSRIIKSKSLKYGAKCPFLRPMKISGKNSTDTSYIAHFLNEIFKYYGYLPYLIIQLRPTTPFRDKKIMEKAIKSFRKNYNFYDSLRSSNILSHPPEKIYRILNNKYVDINLKSLNTEFSNKPSGTFKSAYKPNGYIDIIKTEYFIKYEKIYGRNICPFITDQTIEIDSPKDLEYAKIDQSKEKLSLIKFINEYF